MDFQNFCGTFYDLWNAKWSYFLEGFQKSEILKNAVSGRWCLDSIVYENSQCFENRMVRGGSNNVIANQQPSSGIPYSEDIVLNQSHYIPM